MKTRELALKDMLVLRDGLLAKGYDVTLLDRCEGGIDFGGNTGLEKDLRFTRGLKDIGAGGHYLDPETLQFAAPLETVIAQFASSSPPFCESNELRLKLKSGFSRKEIGDVQECVERVFGAVPDVIYNRRFDDCSVVRTSNDDSPDNVNIYLGFDLEKAVGRWTTPRPEWPNIRVERLFKCWNCKSRKPCSSFSHAKASHFDEYDLKFGCDEWGDTTFFGLLGRFHLGHEYPCCDICYSKLTHTSKLALVCIDPPPPKRRRKVGT
jgi:hypothetical protein